jgi:hypothetical protein
MPRKEAKLANMNVLTKTIIAAGGFAAFAWFNLKRKRPAGTIDDFAELGSGGQSLTGIEVDDDEAAEIIRRARPELERARELVGRG